MVERRERAREVGRGRREVVRGGPQVARRPAAPRARTGGCRRAAAASPRWRAGGSPRSAGASARAAGPQLLGGRPEQRRVALDLPSVSVVWRSAPGSSLTASRHVRLLGGELAHHRRPTSRRGRRGRRRARRARVLSWFSDVIRRRRLLAPLGDRAVDAREVAVRRLEAPAAPRAGRAPRPSRPAPGVADQQLQVVARVGVELGEDLVGVDVGRGRARSGSCSPPSRPARRRCPARGR